MNGKSSEMRPKNWPLDFVTWRSLMALKEIFSGKVKPKPEQRKLKKEWGQRTKWVGNLIGENHNRDKRNGCQSWEGSRTAFWGVCFSHSLHFLLLPFFFFFLLLPFFFFQPFYFLHSFHFCSSSFFLIFFLFRMFAALDYSGLRMQIWDYLGLSLGKFIV